MESADGGSNTRQAASLASALLVLCSLAVQLVSEIDVVPRDPSVLLSLMDADPENRDTLLADGNVELPHSSSQLLCITRRHEQLRWARASLTPWREWRTSCSSLTPFAWSPLSQTRAALWHL